MKAGQQNRYAVRGRNNNNNRKPTNPHNRVYESSGPDVKIRGSAQHIAEKYALLSRDALATGDRIIAENYLQHAEHYNRIVAANQVTASVVANTDKEVDLSKVEEVKAVEVTEIIGQSKQSTGVEKPATAENETKNNSKKPRKSKKPAVDLAVASKQANDNSASVAEAELVEMIVDLSNVAGEAAELTAAAVVSEALSEASADRPAARAKSKTPRKSKASNKGLPVPDENAATTKAASEVESSASVRPEVASKTPDLLDILPAS